MEQLPKSDKARNQFTFIEFLPKPGGGRPGARRVRHRTLTHHVILPEHPSRGSGISIRSQTCVGDMTVALSVDECRAKAAECDRIAAQTPDPAIKAAYQQMAQAWREVAD